MKVADESSVERLRRKAAVLETKNEYMSKQIALLMRENLRPKVMSLEAIDQNLHGLLEHVTSQSSSAGLTRPCHEGQPREKVTEKKPKKGHGPTPQPTLDIVPEIFELDEADRFCRLCGDPLERWAAADDEMDLIDSIQRKMARREGIQLTTQTLWTQPGLPLKPGRCGTRTHDYKRNGTITLFAALCTVTGHIISECMPRHRHQEWLAFLTKIEQEVPKDLDIHIIRDSYATHKHETVLTWLAKTQDFICILHRQVPLGQIWLNASLEILPIRGFVEACSS